MSKLLITGANGFLGKHVVQLFKRVGYTNLLTPSSSELDLSYEHDVMAYFEANDVSSVIHLAAFCGGIGLNAKHPASMIMQNLAMGLNIIQASTHKRTHEVRLIDKLLLLGTVCMYPKFTPVPFREQDLWNGYPEETNAPYGIAKKTIMLAGQAARKEFGLDCITLIPVNMAGEYDHFELDSSHVIPALIAKMESARINGVKEVTLWGDGSASREFLYAGDCARAILYAFESYSGEDPLNIGTGQEITIKELAEKVASKVGYTGIIKWDAIRPNGQPRRCLDVNRAREAIDFVATTPLDETLDKSIDFYRTSKA